MSEIAKFMPSNTQLLAQRQHEELQGLRAEVADLRIKTALLQRAVDQAEADNQGLLAAREWLLDQAAGLTLERNRTARALAWLLAAQTPPFLLAGLAGGFLAVIALRVWGW